MSKQGLTDSLENRLRYTFRNTQLLQQAMTHRSHSTPHNERLEFLGDSVLNCAIATLLYQRFPTSNEGGLSRVRAYLVKQQTLYEIARALDVADCLRLGEGELKNGGCQRPSILANALEAIVGAVHLDGGFERALAMIEYLYAPRISEIDINLETVGKDDKTLLQEYLQSRKIALPRYTVTASHGTAHHRQFKVQCEIECTRPKYCIKVFGLGTSHQMAEQAAAKHALAKLAELAEANEVQ